MSLLSFDAKSMTPGDAYRIMIGTIVPRPIAFVSTCSPTGVGNLAPFSFFNGVASNPPSIMFAITRKPDGGKKDTLVNIEATGEFVVNFVSHALGPKMNQTSADFPYGVDEMAKVGLTPLDSLLVKPKRVLESLVHYECRLYHHFQVGKGDAGSSTIVVGEIVQFHISERVFQNGRVNLQELDPLARLAGQGYCRVTETFEMPRPKI